MRTGFSAYLVFLVGLSQAASFHMQMDEGAGAAARHGLEVLNQALLAQGHTAATDKEAVISVIAGLSQGGAAADRLRSRGIALPSGPESLAVHRIVEGNKTTLVLCGADSRGLMYAALDTAQRVGWSKDRAKPLTFVRDSREKPLMTERAVSMYTMQRAYFENRLFDEKQWRTYFDMLASSRINRFVVIFGYENGGFMAPLYPYFFDVEAYPDVTLVGTSAAEQQRRTAAFRAMMRIAHQCGIDVTVGIWDHIYRGGVQGGGIAGASELAGKRTPGLVFGVTADNLSGYTKAALRKFLDVFPEVDGIEFRMHDESGLKHEEMASFWHQVFSNIQSQRPGLPVQIRAKGLPDSIIDDGLAQKLQLRVETKFWMEQMGLPFHPTHINRENQQERRHGYADLLRYPQKFPMQWRLWSGGTARLLLWGDPEYVRQYVNSARLYNGQSFEVNEMLATKMLGTDHGAAPTPILNEARRYYEYEHERYWHFFQLWGRLGYDPATPAEVWQQEFGRRFGETGGKHVAAGLHAASRVLPRIVASSYPYSFFPTTRGWAEMMRMGDLPRYAAEHVTDTEQFMSAAARAKQIVRGEDTARRTPESSSRWFAAAAEEILREAAAAGKSATAGKELTSTLTDLKILAHLAEYHAQRLLAAVDYSLYKETGDLARFESALARERAGLAAWDRIVAAAGDVYNEDLAFGVQRVGFPRHWKEEREKLASGLKQLDVEFVKAQAAAGDGVLRVLHAPVRRAAAGEPILIRATGAGANLRGLTLNVAGNAAVRMSLVSPSLYEATLPPRSGEQTLRYRIETRAQDNSVAATPELQITVTADSEAPSVVLQETGMARPGQDLQIRANASDASGIQGLRLRYRHLNQFEDYNTLEMQAESGGTYSARVPGAFLNSPWDLMYFIEAIDTKGNGRIYPALETGQPYRVVHLTR